MKLASAAALLSLLPSASAVLGSAAKKDASAAVVKPVERSLQSLTGTFAPLTCNTADLDAASCTPWSSSFGTTEAGVVTIPCNACISMGGFTAGETVTVGGGLNILGRLDFPDGTKVNVETPNVFVQGKLSMSLLNDPISGDPDVKITMTGDTDQMLTPEAPNAAVCPSGGCNVGPKAIVVAGGQLDIDAIGDTCPTWSYVLDYTDAGKPNPTSGYPTPPTLDLDSQAHCTNTLVSSNFDDATKGIGGIDAWWGNLGAPASVQDTGGHDGTKYLQVSRRTDTWQGPYRELFHSIEKPCLSSDAVYVFSAKVRLTPNAANPNHVSACSTDSTTNCPGLRFQYMKPDDYVVWNDLVVADAIPADGTWFDIAGSFLVDSEWADPANIFATFTINGPEKEIDISVDDFVVELAPASLYPDPNDVCADLVSNGDAELGVAFPFRNYLASNPLKVVDDGSGTNKHFYITQRTKSYSTLAFEVVTGCLVPGSAYTFSAKIRVDSTNDVIPRLQFKAEKSGETTVFNTAGSCGRVNKDRGYVQCTFDVAFTDVHYDADRVTAFLNLTPVTNGDTEATEADAYFDDVALLFKAGLTSGGIHVDTAVTSSCYSPGVEAVIPSDDLSYSRSQPVTLSDISEGGIINVEENTARVPTRKDQDEDAAGQFAFLSRKVEFVGEGGTLTVLGTPDVDQKLKGVGIIGFGQDGVVGRSPIAFTLSGDSTDSLISKNAIRSSKNRCVHISGTNNLQITENVAYDTQGHCYALQEGSETGNAFTKNLGAYTRKAETALSGESDDTEPSTFYITNPSNTYTDNVAGGSQSSGYLIATTSTASLTAFSGNVAHSNLVAGLDTSATGYNPTSTATLSSIKTFRNTGPGIRLRSSTNVVIDGGYAADNRDGVLLWKGESNTVSNMAVIGQTSLYKDMSDAIPDTPKLCTGYADGPAVGGVRIHPNGGAAGVQVTGVTFSGFSIDAGCQPASGGNTAAIALVADDAELELTYDTAIAVASLIFADATEAEPVPSRDQINYCGPAGRDLFGITVTDDGSLAPPGVTSTGSGAVISEGMTCSSSPIVLEGACSNYCNGGTVGEGTSPAASPTEGTSSGGSSPTTSSSTVATTCISDGTFENGLGAWYPGPSAAWSQAEITSPGFGGGSAAKSHHRKSPSMSGLWQNFDPNCFTTAVWYEVTADIKAIHNTTLEPFECDPYNMWYGSPSSCPFGTLVLNRNPLTRIEVMPTVGPLKTDTDGWQKMYGAFKATSEIIAAGAFPLMFSSGPDNVDLMIDNVVVSEVTDLAASIGAVDCASPVVNGNFETGDLRGWFARGNSNGGDLSVVPGVGGAGSAIKHSGERTQRWHGILQLIPQECFTEGSTWSITAKFRMFDSSGSAVTCDKTDPLADDSCPTFELSPNGDNNWEDRELPLTNIDSASMVTGEWNVIQNTKTINAAHANYDSRFSWFTINSVDPQYSYEIDDVVMTKTS